MSALHVAHRLTQRVTDEAAGIAGNCMVACFASVYGDAIEDWPALEYGDAWWARTVEAWAKRGYAITPAWPDAVLPAGAAFAIGTTHRHPTRTHVVVYVDGRMVHDPHPDRTGLLDVQQYWVLAATDPNAGGTR